MDTVAKLILNTTTILKCVSLGLAQVHHLSETFKYPLSASIRLNSLPQF